jgi:hypothetical protein
MGEGAAGVSERVPAPLGEALPRADGEDASERRPGEIEREVESLRFELDGLVSELDRRRHELLDVRVQIQRHSRELKWVAAAGGALALGGLALRGYRRRRRERPLARLEGLARVVASITEDPDRVARRIRGERDASATAFAVLASLGGIAARAALARALRGDGARATAF